MLKEVDQNIDTNMSSSDHTPPDTLPRDRIAFHRTNVYQSAEFSVTTMAASPNRVFLVARRACLSQNFMEKPFSKLDIYDITSKECPRYILSIIDYQDITGLAWLDEKHFISVSRQSTISVYSVKLGIKIKEHTTDYGPISCMKHSVQDSLLITGTEYGYAVGYKIAESGSLIACDKKMVKINGSITAIDFHVRPRDVPMETSLIKTKRKHVVPSKRKRSDSSDESGNEVSDVEDGSKMNDEFLSVSDITIIGACNQKAVIWDYHKMKILDSISLAHNVCSVLALKNGDFVIGDSTGNLGFYDHVTLTCRQSEKISKLDILCLARNVKNSIVLGAGREPVITLLKIDKSSESQDEYMLFELIRDHLARVNCALFTSKKEFFTCSDDDLIIKFRMSRSEGKRKLKRYVIKSNHQANIHFGQSEILTIIGSRMELSNISTDTQMRLDLQTLPRHIKLPAPKRVCLIKAYAYIHAAAFDDKFICYSTYEGVTIIDRPKLTSRGRPSQDLPHCHILKLCQSSRYLVAGQQKKVTITRLDQLAEQVIDGEYGRVIDETKRGRPERVIILDAKKMKSYETICSRKLKGMVRDILYNPSDEQLIVSCGISGHSLYILQLPKSATSNGEASGGKIDFIQEFSLSSSPLCHLALNCLDCQDTNLYIFTTRNQIIKIDTRLESLKDELNRLIQDRDRVPSIAKDKNICGMVVLSSSQCLLYNSNSIMKLDIDSNEIVNQSPEYDNINTVSNWVFGQPGEILIA